MINCRHATGLDVVTGQYRILAPMPIQTEGFIGSRNSASETNKRSSMQWALLVLTSLVVGVTPAYADCTDQNAVWSATDDSIEVRLEITAMNWSPEIRFEGWKAGQMLWTLDGQINCSNGVVECGLDLPLSDGTSLGVPVELIRREENLTEYFVFAHLAQTAYQAQRMEGVTLQVARTNGTANSDPIELPSIYRLLRCD